MTKNFLTKEEREKLRSEHRKERDRKVADRIKAVLSSDAGWTYREISEILLIDEQTISGHVEEYKDNKKLELNSGGSASKLTSQQTVELSLRLEQVTYLKVKDICAYVSQTYGASYSIQGMTSWLHDHKFSYKKPKGVPAKADPARQAAFIAEYDALKSKVSAEEPIIFLDAVHPTMETKITYGWIKTGTDKPIATAPARTRMNIVGGLNLMTMTLVTKGYDTINSSSLSDYLLCIKSAYPCASNIHLISDQSSYNTAIATQEAAKKLGITMHYLPPYSPNLNPIERVWKVMNEEARNNRYFASAKAFREKIEHFFTVRWMEIALSMKSRINDNFQRINSTVPT